jgi:hypothetical protein
MKVIDLPSMVLKFKLTTHLIFQGQNQDVKWTMDWCKLVEAPLNVQIVKLDHCQIA